MTLEKNDIEKLAELAKLTIDDDALPQVQQSLQDVLNLVDQLQAADTDGIEPMAHPLDAVQRLRADQVTEDNQRDAMLSQAPATEAGLFLVPRVVE